MFFLQQDVRGRQTSTPASDRGSHVDGYLVLRFTTVQLLDENLPGMGVDVLTAKSSTHACHVPPSRYLLTEKKICLQSGLFA
jgi:hypothetical protein